MDLPTPNTGFPISYRMEVGTYGKGWNTGWELLYWCCLFVKIICFFGCFFITALTVWVWSPFFLVSSLIRFLKCLKFLHFLSQIAHEAISAVTSRKKSICSFFSSPLSIYRSLSGGPAKNREKMNGESVCPSKYFLLHIIFVWEDERPVFFRTEVTQFLPIPLDSWWAAAGSLFVLQ